MQSCSFLFLPFSVCIEWWKMSSFPIWLSATNTGKVWTPEVVYLHRLCVRRDFFHVSVCVSIFKKLCVWLNRRKWLWLPQEMREETRSSDPSGCTGATRRLTGQREGGQGGGWTKQRYCFSLCLIQKLEGVEATSEFRTQENRNVWSQIFGTSLFWKMTLIRALAALLCCCWSSALMLDPGGKNVCEDVRFVLFLQ